MKRSFGRVQRRILAALEAQGALDVSNVARLVFSEPPSNAVGEVTWSQLVSVRRALKTLRLRSQVFRIEPNYVLGRGKKARALYAGKAAALAQILRIEARFGNEGLAQNPDLLRLASATEEM